MAVLAINASECVLDSQDCGRFLAGEASVSKLGVPAVVVKFNTNAIVSFWLRALQMNTGIAARLPTTIAADASNHDSVG